MQFDKLNEIAKLAALKATTALSKLLQSPIGVDIVPVEVRSINEIENLMNSQENIVGSYVPLVGSLSGASMLIYTEDSAFAICDAILHREEGASRQFTPVEISALTELANIVIGNFLSAFAIPLKIDKLMHRAPHFNNDHFYIFLNRITPFLSDDVKDGLIVDIAFHFKHVKISGMAIFLFNEKEMKDVVKKLGGIYSQA